MSPQDAPKKMGRPRREPGETSTRERILRVALDLFTIRGFGKTTFREIAEELGLTESAIYRHFANKDEVLETILVQFRDQVYQPLAGLRDGAVEGGVTAGVLTGLPRLLLTDPQYLQVSKLLLGELHHNERIRSFVKEAFDTRANAFLEELVQESFGSSSPSSSVSRTLAILINSFRFGWVYSKFVLTNSTVDDLPLLERELSDISSFLDEAIFKQIPR